MMIYNNPWFAGYEMTVPEIESWSTTAPFRTSRPLTAIPTVHELKFHLGDKLNVFYGHDYCALEGLLVGADGWLSGFPAVLPKQCRALLDAAQSGDVKAPSRLSTTSSPTSTTSSTTRWTAYLTGRRSASTPCRLRVWTSPVCPASPWASWNEANKKKIEKLLTDMD